MVLLFVTVDCKHLYRGASVEWYTIAVAKQGTLDMRPFAWVKLSTWARPKKQLPRDDSLRTCLETLNFLRKRAFGRLEQTWFGTEDGIDRIGQSSKDTKMTNGVSGVVLGSQRMRW